MFLENKSIKIAVIGKSSSGKSAFIKSFSNYPELITSEGNGQTTRAYGEYIFHNNGTDILPKVHVEILREEAFAEIRTKKSLEKLQEILEEDEIFSINWMKSQYEDEGYKKEIDEALIYLDEFFNINEFCYLDNGKIVKELEQIYNIFASNILNAAIRDFEDSEGINKEFGIIEENDDEKQLYVIEKMIKQLFKDFHRILIEKVCEYYTNINVFREKNNTPFITFEVEEASKHELSRLLKVVERNDKQESLTGMISKVNIISNMSHEYSEIFKHLNIDTVTLIDTYGLNHDQQIQDDLLRDRYNRIFNVDYPEVTVTLFIEALHKGSPVDFTKALTVLYAVRPDIMTYVIGTYIDEHSEDFISDNIDWLTALDKDTVRFPSLNGKVIEIIFKKDRIKNKLRRNDISEVLAEKRQEVMRKKFGPFCGNNESQKQYMSEINKATIKSVFTSIISREHLGDEYIRIDHIIFMADDKKILKLFLEHMIDKITKNFNYIHNSAAARTKGKIRMNLGQYILGFDGTTLDATWRRVLNAAYNESFTKEIIVSSKKTSLSGEFHLEGNEKLAFDELLNVSFNYIFNKECSNNSSLNPWEREISCRKCRDEDSFSLTCMWGILISAAGVKEFKNSSNYSTVYGWLNHLHDFNGKISEPYYVFMLNLFSNYLKSDFIDLARQHNLKIAGKSIKLSDENYLKKKAEVFNQYKEKYDNQIEMAHFNNYIKRFL
ncbi:hypothetical protein [Paenibacillus xylanexedens]|uniref:hypothetical protein n=1 Tax=Paenibacillus xylanexedens TaxID=528191 RepID=UPI003B022BE9